jgi:ribosome biogenesis GTPase
VRSSGARTRSDDDRVALEALGWDVARDREARAAGAPQARPGRVARVDRGLVTVLTAGGGVRVAPGEDGLATGDWVLVGDDDGTPRVVALLARRSAFVRGDPFEGRATASQVVAANVDTVFVVHSLTAGPNLRRLERELVLVYESRADPVVVLTKADLVDDAAGAVGAVGGVAPAVDVVVTSSVTGAGVDALRGYGTGHRTIALIGASGVGKSTLINRLVGADVQPTGAVRAGDQRGRHTTTARELVVVPGGGVLVDTPGLRAVSLWESDEGFAQAFADVEALAAQCRFHDCAHGAEPGCAVRAAVERGDLDAARLDSYVRLDRELDAVARRREERRASRAMRKLPRNPR